MYKYLFGPVPSRRLGMSLGVDLVPYKTCTFDCVYCESGKTTLLTRERDAYVPFNEVKEEIDHFWAHHPDPDFMTFSGSGEPTLNSDIGRVIRYIKSNRPDIRVAVLTNGSLLGDEQVQQDLMTADLVVPSLDAALAKSFTRINRPCDGIDMDTYIGGLASFSAAYPHDLCLEIFILPGYNDTSEDFVRLGKVVRQINPSRIQLNTLDRPGIIKSLRPAMPDDLEKAKTYFKGYDTQIIASVKDQPSDKAFRKDMETAILETVLRRPCTAADLASVLGETVERIETCLAGLRSADRIESVVQDRGKFYQIKKDHEVT